jgi:DNA-binding transcriptional LysR family regulator
MRATFRQLKLLLALAESGSITGAARLCHVTQPTVSMQLRDLSEAVGLPLYEQLGRTLRLTEAGEALARTARTMVDEWEAFGQTVARMKGLEQGRLRITVASTAKYFVPRMLGSFFAAHPHIDISLQVLNRDGVVARMREHRDDLYILSMPPSDLPLVQQVFLPNPLVVVAPLSHDLAAKRSVSLARLQREPFILREPGSGTRMACDAHFKARSFLPRVRLELGSNEAIKQSVASGIGLSVLSRHALAANPADDGLAVLPAQHFPVRSSWSILFPNGRRLSPIAAEFLRHLTEAAKGWVPHV